MKAPSCLRKDLKGLPLREDDPLHDGVYPLFLSVPQAQPEENAARVGAVSGGALTVPSGQKNPLRSQDPCERQSPPSVHHSGYIAVSSSDAHYFPILRFIMYKLN